MNTALTYGETVVMVVLRGTVYVKRTSLCYSEGCFPAGPQKSKIEVELLANSSLRAEEYRNVQCNVSEVSSKYHHLILRDFLLFVRYVPCFPCFTPSEHATLFSRHTGIHLINNL